MKNILIKMPEDVQYIIRQLDYQGYEAYIVGGCVRDSIMGRNPKDWDISTNAKPEDVMELFSNTVPTGLKHGTVTVMLHNVGYEVTTFRIDGQYEDNRHPQTVEFVEDVIQDLSRRDLTINSMAYSDSKGLIDPFGGICDIRDKIIKCVGNPYDRFNEDALRMLRAIRFSAQLGFDISFGVRDGIHSLCRNLSNISIERIRDEFNKILISNSDKLYELMDLCLFNEFLPELNIIEGYKQNNPYHDLDLLCHTFKSVNIIDDKLHLRLTMLLHDIGKVRTRIDDEKGISHYYGHSGVSVSMASDILKRMKYDNETISKVLTLIKYHDCPIGGKSSIKKFLNKIGENLLRDLIQVKWSDILAQNPKFAKTRIIDLVRVEKTLEEVLNDKECFSIKNLAINGKDLIELGYTQGREIGEILNLLLYEVIDDSCINTKEKLIEIIKGFNKL